MWPRVFTRESAGVRVRDFDAPTLRGNLIRLNVCFAMHFFCCVVIQAPSCAYRMSHSVSHEHHGRTRLFRARLFSRTRVRWPFCYWRYSCTRVGVLDNGYASRPIVSQPIVPRSNHVLAYMMMITRCDSICCCSLSHARDRMDTRAKLSGRRECVSKSYMYLSLPFSRVCVWGGQEWTFEHVCVCWNDRGHLWFTLNCTILSICSRNV